MLLGTSMGGARPKAVVQDDDALWVAKFNRSDDRWNNTRVEHAMLRLARECGIRAAESRIDTIGGRDVLLVKRFDREKIGAISLSAARLLEVNPIHQHSGADVKIRLFRSLFRGRDDVYPRRFESRKTGKAGYAPACGNEWIRGICEKPKIKCGDCQYQRFLPVTDEVIRWHLSGFDPAGQPFVAGIYPMLQDETCFFLAIDFDKEGWREDARAFLETCSALGVPAVLERSRSGQGGHVWVFFEEAITAASARRLGSFILTETMERHPDLGFSSYDRFFPNQDTLPHGGFGNLIALPLQKQPRDAGNTVFLDDQMVPHEDQWSFLSSLQRVTRTTVEDLVARC